MGTCEGGCGGEPRWKGENGNVERKRKRRKKGNIKHYVQKIREFLRLGEANYSTAARVRMYGTASWGTMIRVRGERHDGVSAGRMHFMYDKKVTGDEEMAQGEAKQKAKNNNKKHDKRQRTSHLAARHAVVVVSRPDGDHAAFAQCGNAAAEPHELRRVLGIVTRRG